MKNIRKKNPGRILFCFAFIVLAGILNSCSTNHSVTNGSPIQKRKYNKGYYLRMFEKRNAEAVAGTHQGRQTSTFDHTNDNVEDKTVDSFAPDAGGFASKEKDTELMVPPGRQAAHTIEEYAESPVENKRISEKRGSRLLKKTDAPGPEDNVEKEKINRASLWSVILLAMSPVSLVLSLVLIDLFPVMIVLGILLALAAFVLGVIGVVNTSEGKRGSALAIVSVILSYLILFVMWYFGMIVFVLFALGF